MKQLLLLFVLVLGITTVQAQTCKYAKNHPACTKASAKAVSGDQDPLDINTQGVESNKKTCKKAYYPCSKYKNMSAKMVANEKEKPVLSLAQKAACGKAQLKAKAEKTRYLVKADGV